MSRAREEIFSNVSSRPELGKEGFLPFPRFWSSNWPFGAPLPGLIVHLIPSIIIIIAPPAKIAYPFILGKYIAFLPHLRKVSWSLSFVSRRCRRISWSNNQSIRRLRTVMAALEGGQAHSSLCSTDVNCSIPHSPAPRNCQAIQSLAALGFLLPCLRRLPSHRSLLETCGRYRRYSSSAILALSYCWNIDLLCRTW